MTLRQTLGVCIRRRGPAVRPATAAWVASACLTGCLMACGCAARTELAPGPPAKVADRARVSDARLQAAAEEVRRGSHREGFRRCVEWLRDYPAHPERDHALFLAAEALLGQNRRIRAFYYLDELLDTYPGSELFVAAVERQYEIADSYLAGQFDRVPYLPFVPESRHAEAIEMLFRVQVRLPGSELAERALRRTADFYFDNRDYDFAQDAYGVFIDRHPRSPQIPVVRLRQAYSNLLQYQGPQYDPTPLIDARTQLQVFASEYPDLARRQDLDAVLEWIDRQTAEKALQEAAWYRRTGRRPAADLLLARTSEAFPELPEGREAARRLGGPAPVADDEPLRRQPIDFEDLP